MCSFNGFDEVICKGMSDTRGSSFLADERIISVSLSRALGCKGKSRCESLLLRVEDDDAIWLGRSFLKMAS